MTEPGVLPHRYAMMPVGDLKPHPANANVGDVDAIEESIGALGFYGVILVHEQTGHILAGEHRWRAATEKGLTELPAIIIDTDARTAEKILTGDNAFARLGRWDTAKLAALLGGMGHDLAGSGFTQTDLTIAELSAADAAGESRDYDPGRIGSVLVIHCPPELVERFRAVDAPTDADRLTLLLDARA